MKKLAKPTVILKSNLNGFLDLNSKSDLDKVMEILNKLMAGNEYG